MPYRSSGVDRGGPNTGGYSDFFASGLRAMKMSSHRSSIFFPKMHEPSPLSPSCPPSSPSLTPGSPSSAKVLRRERTVSMFVSPVTERMEVGNGKRASTYGHSSLLNRSDVSRRKLTKHRQRKAAPKIQIIAEQEDLELVDPFASSPNSQSFFIDLVRVPSSSPSPVNHPLLARTRSQNRSSFLSLGDSSCTTPSSQSSSSSIRHSLFGLRFPFARRSGSRPTSVHTTPISFPESDNSRSRRLSFYSTPAAVNSWLSACSSSSGSESRSTSLKGSPIQERDEYSEADIDWHQFHVEFYE